MTPPGSDSGGSDQPPQKRIFDDSAQGMQTDFPPLAENLQGAQENQPSSTATFDQGPILAEVDPENLSVP